MGEVQNSSNFTLLDRFRGQNSNIDPPRNGKNRLKSWEIDLDPEFKLDIRVWGAGFYRKITKDLVSNQYWAGY